MSDTKGGSRIWVGATLVLGVAAIVFLVLWLTGAGDTPPVRRPLAEPTTDLRVGPPSAQRAPEPPSASQPAPSPPPGHTPDPYGFDWDPFGDEWEQLFEWPAPPGLPENEQLDAMRQRMQVDMQRMREEMRRMREEFRGRMRRPSPPPRAFRSPLAPRPKAAPPAPPVPAPPRPAPDGARPDGARPDDAERVAAGVEVARLDLPDALVFIVRGPRLVEGSLTVRVDDGRIVLGGEVRDPDGVTGRFSRSLALDGPIAAAKVDVRPVDGGYRVVLPRAED